MCADTISHQVGWIRNYDNITYKTQKPRHENSFLKFADLLQTQRFIENLSISTTLVPYTKDFPISPA